MDFEDPLAFTSYIYSVFALAAYAYGGYALKVVSIMYTNVKDKTRY